MGTDKTTTRMEIWEKEISRAIECTRKYNTVKDVINNKEFIKLILDGLSASEAYIVVLSKDIRAY